MKQEFTPPLFKAKRTDRNGWVEGFYGLKGKDTDLESHNIMISTLNNGSIDSFYFTDYEINPSTLCMDSGLTAEWVLDGIDPRLWSGDILETESLYHRGERYKWEVTYKKGAFYVQRTYDEEIEYLLLNFISDNVYKKIGSIHENEGK